MREAVGSTFLFKIMIIFIFFFTAFLAIAINYSQAFKAKNQVINALEQSEGYNATSKDRIANIVSSSGYFREVNCEDDYFKATDKSGHDLKGICIKRTGAKDATDYTYGSYYSVITYVHFNFPIIGDIVTIPVRGETKLIVNDNFE